MPDENPDAPFGGPERAMPELIEAALEVSQWISD